MMNFLRIIRKSLIESGSARKYLLYAIGEIVLVVIGILLALQVNNWNENRKRSHLAKEILIQIRSDIEGNLTDVTNDLRRLEIGLQSHANITRYVYTDMYPDRPYVDSMCFDFEFLIRDEYTTGNGAGYDELKEVGFDLVKNDSLKWRIKSLYEIALPRISPEGAFYMRLEELFSPYYNRHFVPNRDTSLRRTYILESDTVEIIPIMTAYDDNIYLRTRGFVPLNFEQLKKDPEFKMLLNRGLAIREFKLRWYRRTKSYMINLMEHLDRVLLEL